MPPSMPSPPTSPPDANQTSPKLVTLKVLSKPSCKTFPSSTPPSATSHVLKRTLFPSIGCQLFIELSIAPLTTHSVLRALCLTYKILSAPPSPPSHPWLP